MTTDFRMFALTSEGHLGKVSKYIGNFLYMFLHLLCPMSYVPNLFIWIDAFLYISIHLSIFKYE